MKKSIKNLILVPFLTFLLYGCTKTSSPSKSKPDVDNTSTISKTTDSNSKSSVDIDDTEPVVTFYLDENTVYEKKNFVKDHRIELPSDPLKDGYLFDKWYTDKELKVPYDIKTRPSESFCLYAGFIKSFVMEAEYVDLDGKPGMGYSSNVEGKAMIVADNGSAKASNGYFVSYLYYNGANLQFDFTAEEDISNVVFVARLSSEFYDIALNDTNFKVLVNDTQIKGYYCDLSGALPVSDENKRPFTNFKLSDSLSLKKGKNTIKLVVNNTNAHGGTMYAEAPIVDCLYLGTDSDLSWNPRTDNLE